MSACSVGEPVAQVNLEREQRDGPVPSPGPRWDGVCECEVDLLAGGVLVAPSVSPDPCNRACASVLTELSLQAFFELARSEIGPRMREEG
jgi:hypothetical protein